MCLLLSIIFITFAMIKGEDLYFIIAGIFAIADSIDHVAEGLKLYFEHVTGGTRNNVDTQRKS